MFGINKNGTKHKIGIIMPAFFPSSRVTYDGGTVEEALDGVHFCQIVLDGTTASNGILTIDLPAGATNLHLIEPTFVDNYQIIVIGVELITATTASLRFRNLDGTAYGGKTVSMRKLFWYK